MIELCINTEDDLEIGETVDGPILNQYDEHVECSFIVLEKITYEEYYDFVESQGLTHKINLSIFDKNFYRVRLLD